MVIESRQESIAINLQNPGLLLQIAISNEDTSVYISATNDPTNIFTCCRVSLPAAGVGIVEDNVAA